MSTNFKAKIDGRGRFVQDIVNDIFEDRGIDDQEHFLNPTEADLLPLDALPNIERAYEKVMYAVVNGYKICVMADVDTDGICSGAIMYRYLMDLGADVYVVINDGKRHGLIDTDLSRFDEADFIIIVDSLDEDTSQYERLNAKGKNVIILDHHTVNPNIPYEKYATLVTSQTGYPNEFLSGAGVTWKFCKYIDDQNGLDFADQYVDLAGIGIVADMMDMREMENRYIVSQALKHLHNPACKKIIGSFEFNSRGIGFSIAPLINAANRMNKNDDALYAFITDENKEILEHIRVLRWCKEEQNKKVEEIMKQIQPQIDAQIEDKFFAVFTQSGASLSGLIATAISAKYQKPTIVLRKQEDEEGDMYYKGSIRASDIDFAGIINDTGLALAIGHPQSAGITIYSGDYDSFIDKLISSLDKTEVVRYKEADVEITIDQLSSDFIDKIHALDLISGKGFPAVTFLVQDIDTYEVGQMSNFKHLDLDLGDGVEVIEWNTKADFEELSDKAIMNEPLSVIGTLEAGFLRRKFVKKIIAEEIAYAE